MRPIKFFVADFPFAVVEKTRACGERM